MKKRRFLFVIMALIPVVVSACKGKVEEDVEKTATVKDAPLPQALGPHSAGDIREWIESEAAKADAESIKRAEEVAGKFTKEEILAGIAVRPKPGYWDNVSFDDRLKTVSIMNTGFSKARIEAGLAEDVEVLNSTLYIEGEEGNIIAVSTPEAGARLYSPG